jgi:hypothetical protein
MWPIILHSFCVAQDRSVGGWVGGPSAVWGHALEPLHVLCLLLQVHRLDVGTGGLMLVAKTRAAAAKLSQDLKEHRMQKRCVLQGMDCSAPGYGRLWARTATVHFGLVLGIHSMPAGIHTFRRVFLLCSLCPTQGGPFTFDLQSICVACLSFSQWVSIRTACRGGGMLGTVMSSSTSCTFPIQRQGD